MGPYLCQLQGQNVISYFVRVVVALIVYQLQGQAADGRRDFFSGRHAAGYGHRGAAGRPVGAHARGVFAGERLLRNWLGARGATAVRSVLIRCSTKMGSQLHPRRARLPA